MLLRLLSLTVLSALFVHMPAEAGKRDPAAVDEAILKNPDSNNVRVLVTALRGCGCRPEHHAVRDAIARVGAPAVPLLVKKMQSSDRWADHLECIYVLGLMGTEARAALPVLKETTQVKHLLPRSYLPVAVAAIEASPARLTDALVDSSAGPTQFAVELLGRMGPAATEAKPALLNLAATSRSSTSKLLIQEAIAKIEGKGQSGAP